MIADFINCSTDLMLKNSIISVSVRSHLQTPPQYISGKAGLSSFRRSADSIKGTTGIRASAQGNRGFIKRILWARSGFGGKRKHIPLSSASPGHTLVAVQAGLVAVAPGCLCSRTAGHRCLPCGCCTHGHQLLTSCMPVSETQNFTSDDNIQHSA